MRILLISYTFPPVAGISPSRVARLARALTERGHETRVLTALRPPRYEEDPRSLALLPDGLEVIRSPARPFRRAAAAPSGAGGAGPGALRLYRRFLKPLVIPDAVLPWYFSARPVLDRLLAELRPQRVYSFAYPFTTHLLGARAARISGAPWVMDYGDPWSFNPMWTVPAWRKALDRRLEGRLVRRASALAVTTEATRRAYREAFPGQPRRGVHLSTCGYDAEPAAPLPERDDGRFRIVYTGVYGFANRGLRLLLEALGRQPDLPWEFHLAGRDNSGGAESLADHARFLGEEGRWVEHGMLPHREALELQRSADLLVLWGWPGGLQVPAKIYEYMAARRPILLLRGDGRDASVPLVEDGPRGLWADPDAEDLDRVLGRVSDLWREGRWEGAFSLRENADYSWERQIGILADLMEEGDVPAS